ncbi:hypothetical protein [Ferruginibacter profundus]
MKEFITYLYCIVFSRNTAFLIEIELNNNWDILSKRVSNSTPTNKDNDYFVTVLDKIITIDEYYLTDGLRSKGSIVIIKNHAHTEIKKGLNTAEVKIEIERTKESSLFTQILIIGNLIFLFLAILDTYKYLYGNSIHKSNLLIDFINQTLFLGLLIVNWIISREKYLSIIKNIKEALNNTNPATNK